MNRSIKFRGQREDTKEWVYGYYWHDSMRNVHMIKSIEFNSSGWNSLVLAETVGQFTGRTDDGEDELYNGDIISFDYLLDGFEGVIEWSEALSAFVVKRKDEPLLFLYDIDDAVTKIGDIYGN